MRKLFMSLLMAGAVLPTAAFAQDREHRGDDRVERAAHRSIERSERSDRGNRDAVRVERVERQQQVERVAPERRFERREAQPVQQVEQRAVEIAPAQRVVRERRDRSIVDGLREAAREQQDRAGQVDVRRGDRDGRSGVSRDADRRWGDGTRDGVRRWSGDWRRDNRYDWRRHRDHNRSIFRFGRYYDPYGYGYRHFSIGFNLWPSYYSSSFWLNDPWMYRLPPAYGPYRWVRYYDDALLVNIYTGQVVDVINNFFW